MHGLHMNRAEVPQRWRAGRRREKLWQSVELLRATSPLHMLNGAGAVQASRCVGLEKKLLIGWRECLDQVAPTTLIKADDKDFG